MNISRELIQVTGFRFGGVNIGLKNESLDFGGIVANSPCAIAVSRTLIALIENGQQADGSITLPKCLGLPDITPPSSK